jgi:hypothetical protein
VRYDRSLFRAHYISCWSLYVPCGPGWPWNWYDALGDVPLPNGAVLMEIYALQHAQVAALRYLWSLPSPCTHQRPEGR